MLKRPKPVPRLDPNNPSSQIVMGLKNMLIGNSDQAIAHLQCATRLNPSSSQALKLNPFNPNVWAQKGVIALAHFAANRLSEAIATAQECMSTKPNSITGHMVLIAEQVEMGQIKEANITYKKLHGVRNNFQLEHYLNLIAPPHYPLILTAFAEPLMRRAILIPLVR